MPIALTIFVLAEESGVGSVIGWSLVLIGLIFVGFFAVSRLRGWLKSEDEVSVGIGFTLSDLKQMRASGQMSEEEYQKAAGKMLAGAREMAAEMPDPLARERRPGREPRQQPPA